MSAPAASLLKTLPLLSLLALAFAGCGGPSPAEGPAPAEQWKVLGPGGGGGIFIPTISPHDPRLVLTHCDMTGGYLSRDMGESWRMFNLWTVPEDFEFDPVDPQVIYASVRGSLYSEDRGSALPLLYRSEDQGKSWKIVYPAVDQARPLERLQSQRVLPSELIPGTPDVSIDQVKVDPADNSRIYLGMSPLAPYISRGPAEEQPRSSALLLTSADRGTTWRQLAELPGRRVVALFPGSLEGPEGRVLAVTDQALAWIDATGKVSSQPLPARGAIAADAGRTADGQPVLYLLTRFAAEGGAVSGGIFRSEDWGQSWKPVNAGLFQGIPEGQAPQINALATCATDPAVAYVSSRNSAAPREDTTAWRYGIFKTEDGGANWKPVWLSTSRRYLIDNHQSCWLDEMYGPGWGGNPIDLGVAPTDPDLCFGSDAGRCYRTTDGGDTWTQVTTRKNQDGSWSSRGLDVTTCYGVHFDPFDPNHLFISYTDIGLFHSYDRGASWFQSLEGVPERWVNTCYWLEFDPAVQGRAWAVWANAHDLPRDKMFGQDGSFERYQGGVSVTADGGRSWQVSGSGIPENAVATHVLVDPDSPRDSRTLYATVFGQGVFRSTDGGATWQLSNNGLGDNLYAWQLRRRASDGRLFVLLTRARRGEQTVAGQLFVSDDQGDSWQPLALPEGVNAPHDLQLDPDDPQRLYLSCWPRDLEGADRFGGVFSSEDGGASWRQVFDERVRVNSLAIHPRDKATIFINTFQNAAYRSDDRGANWRRLEGYRFKWGQRVNIDPRDPENVYLTTYGGSVAYGPAQGLPGVAEDAVNVPPSWW